MRLSKNCLVIAIFGKSCTGKSTVADKLGEFLNAEVRHCGEILKSRALQLRKSVSDLSSADHRLIDSQTRDWASGASVPRVVEGIFLAEVLSGLEGVVFIRLVCDTEVRERRLRERQGSSSSIQARDKEDDLRRQELYHEQISSPLYLDLLEIDTTKRAPHEVVAEIIAHISSLGDEH